MLMDAGLEDQVVLSSDLGNTNHLKANWGLGYSTVLLQFVRNCGGLAWTR